jgi:predicted nuclease of restriction endonuclease-like (RecB) superfamily
MTPEEAIKDPLVVEFLDLKDEYSESDLEEANSSKTLRRREPKG